MCCLSWGQSANCLAYLIVNPTDELPADADPAPTPGGHVTPARKRRQAEGTGPLPVAVVIVYKSLARLLPERYDPDRRSLRSGSLRPSLSLSPPQSLFLYLHLNPPHSTPISLHYALLQLVHADLQHCLSA